MHMLNVKYRCLNPSCVVNCREGVLSLDEETIQRLRSFYEEDNLIKSPRGACRMGYSQKFEIISVEDPSMAGAVAPADFSPEALGLDDPIGALTAEHQIVLKKLDDIENQIRRRDMDGLWVSTIELENEVRLHSIQKEEEILFPLLSDLIPLGEGLVNIVNEDHVELANLIHSFRDALADEMILDGIGHSIIGNLRSHIRKEDEEFFVLINKCLDGETRKRLLVDFKKADEAFVPVKPGERPKGVEKSKERQKYEEEAAKALEEARESASGCCH